MRTILAFTLALSAAQMAFGDSKNLREEEKECSNYMSYEQISSCYSALYRKTDQELNSQYSELSESLDSGSKNYLVAAQRLWVKFRDADCMFYEPRKENDDLVSSSRSICLTRRTLDRLEQIEHYNFRKGCNGWCVVARITMRSTIAHSVRWTSKSYAFGRPLA